METSKPKGILMGDDTMPPPVAKDSKQHGSYAGIIVFWAVYALFFVGAILYGAIEQRDKRIEALSRANFGEVVKQRPLTLEDAAADPGISARMGPERWYDEYCVVGGRVNEEGDYDYMRLTPGAYAALKRSSEYEVKVGYRFSIYGSAMEILNERRKAQATASPPSAK